MKARTEFQHNWISAPGDTISDILSERKLSVGELAKRMDCRQVDLIDLIQGRAVVTLAIARQLEKVLGASVEYWMTRDYQYRHDVERLHMHERAWIKQLPLSDMIRFGWIRPTPHPKDEADACLRFFDVNTISEWREKYSKVHNLAAFRTSSTFDSSPAAVAAWLRQGEILSQRIETAAWSRTGLESAIQGLRSLTRIKEPSVFLPKLVADCAKNGVAVIVVRAPSGCRASGATRFMTAEKALIQLSFRYLSDDQFWFSFFHELGHLLLHPHTSFFLEGIEGTNELEEKQASDFAAEVLIPRRYRERLMNMTRNSKSVIRFAVEIGVSPGIVVGQLQHFKKIESSQLNKLKRHFVWAG